METQGKSVLIKPEEGPEQTGKGVMIPKTVKDKPNIGIVLDVGPGCSIVKRGDRVQYERKGASVMMRERSELHWIVEEQIFYVYE